MSRMAAWKPMPKGVQIKIVSVVVAFGFLILGVDGLEKIGAKGAAFILKITIVLTVIFLFKQSQQFYRRFLFNNRDPDATLVRYEVLQDEIKTGSDTAMSSLKDGYLVLDGFQANFRVASNQIRRGTFLLEIEVAAGAPELSLYLHPFDSDSRDRVAQYLIDVKRSGSNLDSLELPTTIQPPTLLWRAQIAGTTVAFFLALGGLVLDLISKYQQHRLLWLSLAQVALLVIIVTCLSVGLIPIWLKQRKGLERIKSLQALSRIDNS